MLASTFQNSLSRGRVHEFCSRENVSYAVTVLKINCLLEFYVFFKTTSMFNPSVDVPTPDVRYQAPDLCAGMTRSELSPTCLNSDNVSGAPPVVAASLLLVGLAAVLLSMIVM